MPERCPTCGGPRDDEPREFYELCGCAIAPSFVGRTPGETDELEEGEERQWMASSPGFFEIHPTREGAIAAWRKERVRRLEERYPGAFSEAMQKAVGAIQRASLDAVMFGTGMLHIEGDAVSHIDVRCEYTDSVMVRAPGSMARITLPDDVELVENPSLKADEQFVLPSPAALCYGCRRPRKLGDVTSPFSGAVMRLCEGCTCRFEQTVKRIEADGAEDSSRNCERCPGTLSAHHASCDVPGLLSKEHEHTVVRTLKARRDHAVRVEELITKHNAELPARFDLQPIKGWEPVCQSLDVMLVERDISRPMRTRTLEWLHSVRRLTLEFDVDVPCPKVGGDESMFYVLFPGYQYTSIMHVDKPDDRERETAVAIARHYTKAKS